MEIAQIPINWWIDKEIFIYPLGIVLTKKKNELIVHVSTWVNLRSIMLHEISQTQKRLHAVQFHLNDILEKAKYRERKQISGLGVYVCGEGGSDWLQRGMRKLLGRWECSICWKHS